VGIKEKLCWDPKAGSPKKKSSKIKNKKAERGGPQGGGQNHFDIYYTKKARGGNNRVRGGAANGR